MSLSFPICSDNPLDVLSNTADVLSNLLIVGVAQFFPSTVVILKVSDQFVVRLVVLCHGSCEVRRHLEHEISDFQTHLFYVSKIKQLLHC